ncbi:TPA: hypothetical protein ACKPX8_004687, partial [Serratia marcescens]
NAQRCPQGEATGRINPARPPIQEKAPLGAFFVSASLTPPISLFFLYSLRAEIRMVIILAA